MSFHCAIISQSHDSTELCATIFWFTIGKCLCYYRYSRIIHTDLAFQTMIKKLVPHENSLLCFSALGSRNQSSTWSLQENRLRWTFNNSSWYFFPYAHVSIVNIWVATWQNQQNECAPSEDSDQPGHPPSLIRVLAVHMKKPCVLNYPLSTQRRLWSDWADSQADPSIRWAHTHFVGFVMSWLIWFGYSLESSQLDSSSKYHVSHDMTKPIIWVWAQQRLRSAWASAQSDQSLDAQADLSLRCAGEL